MIPPAKNAKKDMLGDLPDCVILHILSFLNCQEAVRTCVLSVRWKNLWKRLPVLKLHKPYRQTSSIFFNFVSKVLSLRDSSISLHALEFKHKVGAFEPRILNTVANYAISHNVQRLRLASYMAKIPSSLCSSHTLTHLKISILYRALAQISLNLPALTYLKLSMCPGHEENLFPKSLYLPALTTLQVEHFTFCAGDNDRAEPFSTFNRLKSLLISDCTVKGARTLCISNATLVNLTMYNDSYEDYDKIDLCTPSLCTSALHGIPYRSISGSNISSLKHVDIDAQLFPYSGLGDPLFIFKWLLEFANITSLTVTATTLQVLSLIPGLLNFNFPSLGKLKSLKVNVDEIQYGVRMKLCTDKLKNVKSIEEAARIRESYELGREPSLPVPDGIVNFLLQNSPSAKVDLVDCTKKLHRWETFIIGRPGV